MPTYDYRCKSCNHEFEIQQNIKDAPLKECPKCQGQIQRIISKNIGISFKGPGFYVTDSKNKTTKTNTTT